jgi:hypothetical protein
MKELTLLQFMFGERRRRQRKYKRKKIAHMMMLCLHPAAAQSCCRGSRIIGCAGGEEQPEVALCEGGEEQPEVALCESWIREHVVRLGLCPYASAPFVEGKIRYAVSEACDEEELLDDFFVEGQILLEASSEELATTMLIAPRYEGSIDEFSDLYTWLVDVLEGDDEPILENGVQPAFFHPDWAFDGLPGDSAIHFEKRAPIPIINLLRRRDLDAVVQQGLASGRVVNKEIAEHNAAALEAEGYDALAAIFATQLAFGTGSGET